MINKDFSFLSILLINRLIKKYVAVSVLTIEWLQLGLLATVGGSDGLSDAQ